MQAVVILRWGVIEYLFEYFIFPWLLHIRVKENSVRELANIEDSDLSVNVGRVMEEIWGWWCCGLGFYNNEKQCLQSSVQ